MSHPTNGEIERYTDHYFNRTKRVIGKFGDATDWVRAEKQTREKREPLPTTPPVPGSFRWYWMLYKQSDRWLGNLAIGEEGLAESTRDARTGLIESLLGDNGERSFAALTRRVLREELKARTPVQAGKNPNIHA